MRNLRTAALVVLVSGLLTVSLTQASAGTKAGARCAKLGKSVVTGSVKMICKRQQGKQVWVRVTPVKPLPKPTAIGTPKDTPTTAADPMDVLLLPASPNEGDICKPEGDEQFAAAGVIRCQADGWHLIEKDEDSVMSRAFRHVRERWLSVKDDLVMSEIYVKPSTGTWGAWATGAYEAGARYWRAGANKMMVRAIISDDGTWLESKARELNWRIGETLEGALKRRPWDSAAVNSFYDDANGIQGAWTHVLSEGPPQPGLNTGVPHEFGHVAQLHLSQYRLERSGVAARVPWLDEGMNSYVGAALSPLYGSRFNTRDEWINRMVRFNVSLVDVSNREITPGGSPLFFYAYAAGFFASEALTAVYGADVMDDLYREFANTRSMNASFIRVLGVDVKTTSQTLDGYIQSVRVRKPWTLSELTTILNRAGFKQ